MWRRVSVNGVITTSETGVGEAWNGFFTVTERLERMRNLVACLLTSYRGQRWTVPLRTASVLV